MKTLFIILGLVVFGLQAQADQTLAVEFQGVEESPVCEFQADPSYQGLPGVMAERGRRGFYYDWGKANNGWGYCYKWTNDGRVLNGGKPVDNYNCERVNPSYHNWGRGNDGWGYCYQWTAYGVAMNQGQPVSNYSCESVNPSYYSWGQSKAGNTRCYQYTANGYAMNKGQPVSDYNCH